MSLFEQFWRRVRRHGLADTLAVSALVATGMVDYWLNPFAKRQNQIPPQDYARILADLRECGFEVVPYPVNVPRFFDWLDHAQFPDEYVALYERHGKGIFLEKALEHYLGAELLDLAPDDLLIDVAAASSPWWAMARRLYGCRAYALDVSFPPETSGHGIGADATAMPLKAGLASKLALHCAYEMFEGDADIRLLPEAARVLVPGGKMVILPLYLHNFYFAETGPRADRRHLEYQGAERVWRENGKYLRFSRKYSVSAFRERIVANLGDLSLQVFDFENVTDIDPVCYCRLAALFTR